MKINRKGIIILIVALCLCFLAMITVIIPGFLSNNDSSVEYEIPDYYFYEPDYETDILSDPEYIVLNRVISYINGAVTIAVEPENYLATDYILSYIAELLDVMIRGDYEAYPSYFSTEYKSENELPEKFTMQRIYNIKIEKISESAEEENGEIYTQYVYMLDYMINRNDGTLRRDIDSDSSRPQFLVITDREGELKIDNIITYIFQ